MKRLVRSLAVLLTALLVTGVSWATTTPAGAVPSGGATDSCSPAALEAPYLVIGNLSANAVTVWNAETYERIATIPLKEDGDTPREHSSPIGTWATPDGRTVMVFNISTDVETIDMETFTVLRTTVLPPENSFADRASVIQDDGRTFWLTTYPPIANLYGIEIATGEISHAAAAPAVTFANSRDGEVLYFSNAGNLEVRDPETLDVLASTPTQGSRVLVSPDDSMLMVQGPPLPIGPASTVLGGDYVVDAIDVSDRNNPTVVKSFPIEGGSWPGAFSPDGTQFWMPYNDVGKIKVFDMTDLTERDIETGESGQGVVVGENGRAYVTMNPLPTGPVPTVSAIGSYFAGIPGGALPGSAEDERPLIDTPGQVWVYDTTTLEKIAEFDLPSNAYMPTIVADPPTRPDADACVAAADAGSAADPASSPETGAANVAGAGTLAATGAPSGLLLAAGVSLVLLASASWRRRPGTR